MYKIENIDKTIKKWSPIAEKLNVKDVYNWCLCIEHALIFLGRNEKSDNLLPLVAKILPKLMDRGIEVRYCYNKILIRKHIIKNFDIDISYEDYILSKKETATYRIINDGLSEEEILFNLSNEIIDDIVNKANGRCFIPFNFINDINKITTIDNREVIELECMYGFL